MQNPHEVMHSFERHYSCQALVKKPASGGLSSEASQAQAMNTAINANKNINTPPTMGKITGAAWAMDSTMSGSCAWSVLAGAVWSAG